MNLRRTIPLIGSLAFVAGFWTACSIGFDPTGPEAQFSCTDNTDCISPNVCKQGVCAPPSSENQCDDGDEDGYGVGDTSDCELCRDQGLCDEDCDDSDPSVNPGAADACDGKDNDCDGEVDEPLTCESSTDCPNVEQPYLPSCSNAGTCEYKPPVQFGAECSTPVACVGGAREDRPPECF